MVYGRSDYKKSSLYDRVKKLLVSFEWSDCCFNVSGKIFKAHKLILCISSPVFEAMFYGPLATDDDIMIVDIEPDVFQLLLNYIYSDEAELTSIEEAFKLLYASKKYLLESLKEICIDYIQVNTNLDNVTAILSYPDYLQEKKLISSSLKLLCQHADCLLQENGEIISVPCIKLILESSHINISEKNLIKYIFNWTELYCKHNDISASIENRRKVLIENGLMKLLRFFTLSEDMFDEILADKNSLLLPYEAEIIRRGIGNNGTKTIDHNDKEKIEHLGILDTTRFPLDLQWELCYRSVYRSVAPVTIDWNNHIIYTRLRATQSILITSLCVPTRMAPELNFHINIPKVYSEQISVSIVCETDRRTVKFTNFMNTVEYDSTVEIELSEPCRIKKNEWHQICFEWPQSRSLSYSYIVMCRDRIFCNNSNNVIFEFDDMPDMTRYSGSFLEGFKFRM